MPDKEVELFIDKEGRVTLLHDDEITDALWQTGYSSLKRASKIEAHTSKRLGRAYWYVRLMVTKPHFWLWHLPSHARALEIEKLWLGLYFRTGKKPRYDNVADVLIDE